MFAWITINNIITGQNTGNTRMVFGFMEYYHKISRSILTQAIYLNDVYKNIWQRYRCTEDQTHSKTVSFNCCIIHYNRRIEIEKYLLSWLFKFNRVYIIRTYTKNSHTKYSHPNILEFLSRISCSLRINQCLFFFNYKIILQ